MSEDGPSVRIMQRAAPGTTLELASYEELLMEIRHRQPTGAMLAVAYPTARPGKEHSGLVDVCLVSGGELGVQDQLLTYLAGKLAIQWDLGDGWHHGG